MLLLQSLTLHLYQKCHCDYFSTRAYCRTVSEDVTAPIPDHASLPESSRPYASWDPFSHHAYGGTVSDDCSDPISDMNLCQKLACVNGGTVSVIAWLQFLTQISSKISRGLHAIGTPSSHSFMVVL